jgi:flavin-dependent dehydrogenase
MASLGGLHCDALVIGGGPAGLAAAIAMRMRGLDVVVADATRPPIDKACGEGILPAGVVALNRLGVRLTAESGFPIHGIRFIEGAETIEAAFRSGCGLGLRRTCLHQLLVARAAELGVRLHWDTAISGAPRLESAPWLVGADGQQSRIRSDAGLDAGSFRSIRFGFRRHYRMAPWTSMVEVYWGHRCQLYVTPVAADEVGVAILTRDSHLRLDCALREFPALQRRLRSASEAGTERGAITTTRRLRRVFRDRTVLIGDASGSVDAIAGEGLSMSFVQAFALADAVAAGDLRPYQAKHCSLARRPALMAGLLLLLDRAPRLRRIVWRGLAFEPSLFSRMLAAHTPPA